MITGSNISVDGGATAKYWPWAPHARLRRSGTGDVRGAEAMRVCGRTGSSVVQQKGKVDGVRER